MQKRSSTNKKASWQRVSTLGAFTYGCSQISKEAHTLELGCNA